MKSELTLGFKVSITVLYYSFDYSDSTYIMLDDMYVTMSISTGLYPNLIYGPQINYNYNYNTTQQKPPHPYTSGWKQIPFTKHVVVSRIMIIDTAQKPSSSRMQRVFQVKAVNLNQISMYPVFWYDGLF